MYHQDLTVFLKISYILWNCRGGGVSNQSFIEDNLRVLGSNVLLFFCFFTLQVTRVIFVNGSIDPWHALGFTLDVGGENHVIYIKGKV